MSKEKENSAIYDTVFHDYGKVRSTLKEILERENMSRYKLADLSGTAYDIITRYYKGSIKRPDLDVLARICFVLNCEISDVLTYERPAAPDETVDNAVK